MSDDEARALDKRVRYLERELRYAQAARERLEELNDRNQVIRNRSNEELNQRNAELRAALDDLVRAQAQLVQAEKMVSLGQLVASVAHELNTPMGAIRASAENLRSAIEEVVSSLPETLATLEPALRGAWRRLAADGLAAAPSPASFREERRLRREVGAALEAAGVGEPGQVATWLVELGLTGPVQAHLDLLRSPACEALLKDARNVVGALRSAENIRVAADRAAKIVFALKSYAHPGGAQGEWVEAALADNIDNVLTIYQGQMKQRVELVRDYADPGLVQGRHDELNQVWTNLLHNALQAMDFAGELGVRIWAPSESEVEVDITDSGRGIPAEIQSRIFEPFFTTKRMGEGSGLGLSICRDIIAKHRGTLSFTTTPGRTTFSVVLPRHVSREAAP